MHAAVFCASGCLHDCVSLHDCGLLHDCHSVRDCGFLHAMLFCMPLLSACRLLNGLPANRTSATALHAFLQTAGFRMHQEFKAQFIKLLQCIYDDFRKRLEEVSVCICITATFRCLHVSSCCQQLRSALHRDMVPPMSLAWAEHHV